jgi:putative peptidoglycan lipid II flippase
MPTDERRDQGAPSAPGRRGAALVAAGILASRLAGLVRDAATAAVFGVGSHADVFRTALRMPNLLQNLLGEGTLSAAFIPIYGRLLAEGRREEAGRFAGAVLGLLTAAAAALVLAGMLLAGPLVAILAPGFLRPSADGVDRYALAVRAVRWIFPMSGLLVLSAWALGVLNSHRRFLVSYAAPVVWNGAIVAALLLAGGATDAAGRDRVLFAACAGALAGGALQLLVQLPFVARELRGFRLALSMRVEGVRAALRLFLPMLSGRGAVQLGGYLDVWLASLLASGAVGALGWAQSLYLLPISLFGMSIAAAELPELAGAAPGGEVDRPVLARRADAALRAISFLTIPTAVGYLLFGRVLVSGLYERGSFLRADSWLVALVLAAYATGLVAANASRMLQNVFYAVRETRAPARVAIERTLLGAALGAPLMLLLDRVALARLVAGEHGGSLRLGAVGLAAASGVAAWWELGRLRGRVRVVVPEVRLPWRAWGRMAAVALAVGLPVALLAHLAPEPRELGVPSLAVAVAVVAVYAAAYLLLSHLAGVAEARELASAVRRRLRR